jgi:hypothetical protein
MREHASDLARRLAQNAEAVCRHYLSNGRRHGRYWLVGDVDNSAGRSLYVRLTGPESGKGAAGKWTDAATGEHGDLLDLIAANQHLSDLPQVLGEARRFLSLPDPEPISREPLPTVPTGSPEAARRLFAISKPIQGTLAARYLRARDIIDLSGTGALRFHPRCFYRPESDEAPGREAWPALIAAVTDLAGIVTGAHRTWLDPSGTDKAPVASPRRAMGQLLGHGVRFGIATDVLAAGEGVETILSLRQILVSLPAVAALSAAHLAALQLRPTLRRLYIARDRDDAGRWAADTLATRAREAGIEPLMLDAQLGDFNDDLRQLGATAFSAHLRVQLAPEDVERFLATAKPARRTAAA